MSFPTSNPESRETFQADRHTRTHAPRSKNRSYPSAKLGEGRRGEKPNPEPRDPFRQDFDFSNLTEADRDHVCSSKRRYDKKGAASVMTAYRRHRGSHGRPENLRAYVCPFGNGWHLTKDA